MKTIPYIPKRTTARTQYRKIQPHNHKYIMDRLFELHQLINECKNDDNEIAREFYLLTILRRPDLPKHGVYPYHHNSINSFVSGILHNFTLGTQYDFSDKTCIALEFIFDFCENHIDGYEAIKFVQVKEFDKPKHPKRIDFMNSLFTISL